MPDTLKFQFSWNGRVKILEAYSLKSAKQEFMRRFGFWPNESTVVINEISKQVDVSSN